MKIILRLLGLVMLFKEFEYCKNPKQFLCNKNAWVALEKKTD